MWKPISNCMFLAAIVVVAGMSGARADGPGQQRAVLSHPGQAVEVRGLRNRVIAFYEDADGRMALTLLLSGGALGAEVLRSRVALRDGQSHAVTMSAGDASGSVDRFSFTRMGEGVRIAVDSAPGTMPLTVGRADPADAASPDLDLAGAEAVLVDADLVQ